jgi:Fe-Mn family superoxide dismutase
MPHELPPLPYDYNALEPHIDEATMKLHHDIHHAGYVKGLNAAEEALAKAREAGDMSAIRKLCDDLAFHGSGHYLHNIFWENMSPNGGGKPSGDLAAAIDKYFGSYEAFEKQFKAAAATVQGSGWGLLVWAPQDGGRLEILQAEKHNNLTQWGCTVLLAIDVWEHAYYLNYQNKRPAYIDAFFNVVNWDDVAKRYADATS